MLVYVDAGSEVSTGFALPAVIAGGKRIVVPWCRPETGELGLFRLDHVDELAVGAHGILEPRSDLRTRADRLVMPAEIDLAFVPGVAFDRTGGRLGQGRGYYDRLLANVRADAVLVGLAFDAQIVAAVPADPHDVGMDVVVTETHVYPGRGRSAGGRTCG